MTGAGRERVCCSVVRWIATGTSTAEDVIAGSVNSGLFCERVLAVKPTALASQISVHVQPAGHTAVTRGCMGLFWRLEMESGRGVPRALYTHVWLACVCAT